MTRKSRIRIQSKDVICALSDVYITRIPCV
jgi:hypothetical protein